jgi:hypothetical protein
LVTRDVAEHCNAGRVRVGIELDRVLARLKESDGAENATLDEEEALRVLGALAIVDPGRVGWGHCMRAMQAPGGLHG